MLSWTDLLLFILDKRHLLPLGPNLYQIASALSYIADSQRRWIAPPPVLTWLSIQRNFCFAWEYPTHSRIEIIGMGVGRLFSSNEKFELVRWGSRWFCTGELHHNEY